MCAPDSGPEHDWWEEGGDLYCGRCFHVRDFSVPEEREPTCDEVLARRAEREAKRAAEAQARHEAFAAKEAADRAERAAYLRTVGCGDSGELPDYLPPGFWGKK